MNKNSSHSKKFYLLFTISVICISIAIFLGARIINRVVRGPHPVFSRQTNVEVIQPWMTLGYISRTFGVPEKYLEEKLLLQSQVNSHANLAELAKLQAKEPQVFIEELKKVITDFQTAHPTPPPIKLP